MSDLPDDGMTDVIEDVPVVFPHRIQQLDCLYYLLFLCTSIYNPFQQILHQDRFYLGNELQYLIVFGLYAASSVCVIVELMWFFA